MEKLLLKRGGTGIAKAKRGVMLETKMDEGKAVISLNSRWERWAGFCLYRSMGTGKYRGQNSGLDRSA